MTAGVHDSADLVGSALAVANATTSLSLIGCQMQAATELQEAQLGRIGSAVAAVSQGAGELAEHASESAAIAAQSERDAKEGSELVQAVSGDLEHAVGTAMQSLELIEALGERVEQVGSIAATINTIASRTKLLALNAAIEAARAGEQGRGFSIVAEEVGKLAQSTAEAASMIAEIITAIQRTRGDSSTSSEAIRESTSRMADGIDRAARAGEAFTRIVSDVERLSTLIAGVASTSSQQAEVASDLDSSARTITVAARSTVRSGQELGRAMGRVGLAADALGAATIASAGGAQAAASASALQAIAADLAPFFELVRQQAGYFHAVYVEAIARRDGRILREDMDALDAPIHAALRRFGDSILGTGTAPVPDLLEDAPLWVHWWFNGPSGPEFPSYDFDPSSPSYYDYRDMEWFHEPSTRLEPWAAGPYFDEGGMDEHLVTLTAPVLLDGRAIGVSTADVRVDQIDKLCRPHLARLGAQAALVTRDGRVVASTDHAWCAPGSDLEAELAQWCATAEGPLTTGEDGRTLARTPTLPWGLLLP